MAHGLLLGVVATLPTLATLAGVVGVTSHDCGLLPFCGVVQALAGVPVPARCAWGWGGGGPRAGLGFLSLGRGSEATAAADARAKLRPDGPGRALRDPAWCCCCWACASSSISCRREGLPVDFLPAAGRTDLEPQGDAAPAAAVADGAGLSPSDMDVLSASVRAGESTGHDGGRSTCEVTLDPAAFPSADARRFRWRLPRT